MNLDNIDRKIIKILSNDARISITRLSQEAGISKTPCQIRMKRLENNGYILGYKAVLDHDKLDHGHIAFVNVTLDNTSSKSLDDFNHAVRKIIEIEQCHMIASNFDYLLKVRSKNINDYRIILGEKISALPHVAQTSTFVVMQNVKENN